MSSKTLIALLIGSLFLAVVTGLSIAQTESEPLPTFSTTFFTGSGDCASCHSRLVDEEGEDISYDTDWRSSMMANSSKDPLWLAKVESEALRTPSLQDAIEDKCATCHMPMAHTEATIEETGAAIFDDGFLNPQNELHAAAMDGISCSLCHQIESEGLGDPSTFGGSFPIDATTTHHRVIFGGYADPDVMRMSGFVADIGLQMADSASCATCHTLYTSAYDENGTAIDAEPFPEQVPYLEWVNSAFGDGEGADSSCQDCHMPPVTEEARIANRGRAPLRTDFGQHYFDGGNTFVLEMLRDHGQELEVTASTAQFTETILRTERLLEEETAVIAIADTTVSASTLIVDLLVSNLTGHKLPTGIPIRRAWIHLQAVGGDGQLLFESGAPLGDGRIQGNAADEDRSTFEPHYKSIDVEDQVQIYEAVMADWNGDVTYTLLRATSFAKDNRLLPLGFDKSKVPEDIAVFGLAEVDKDFTAGQDEIRYKIPVGNAVWPVAVTAELLYQPVVPGFVDDLAIGGEEYAVRFAAYYETADRTPDSLGSLTTEIAAP